MKSHDLSMSMLSEGKECPDIMTTVPGRRPAQRVTVTYLSGECAGSGLGAAGWDWGLLVALAASLHWVSPGWSLDFLSARIPEKAPCSSQCWNRSTRDKKTPTLRHTEYTALWVAIPQALPGQPSVCPVPFRDAPGKGTVPSWALGTCVLLLPLHASALCQEPTSAPTLCCGAMALS